ncbi:NACHT domain-containing protein [Paractinoplanes atraurantiacus]|uniref:NACHT domain-containing protein n=1 Tax=Paractinoplanes atraurantiacus TaxID=1036182 RepID=A0A285K3W7_9ACTN|nr:NACHT domain-containing protein [Actinoplanes atraurantiacus]SNY66963.1 NACHT domain-containing protein [Actinoplanes atraurantiacus]
MTDAFFVALLGVAGQLVQGLTTELVLEMRRRRLPAAQLGSRELDRAVDTTRRRLADLRALSPDEWQAATDAAAAALAGAGVTLDLVFELDLDPSRLAKAVESRGTAVAQRAGLSAAGETVYRRVIGVTCDHVVTALQAQPGFERLLQLRTYREIRKPSGLPDPDSVFTARYVEVVTKRLGQFELFGVTRGRRPRRHAFDKYVSLAVARGAPDDDEEGLTGVGIDVANALADHPRAVIRGGAGAGKTTLLQWIAAAQTGLVPFFVPLRQFAHDGAGFPSPEQLPGIIAGTILGEMPAGWASRRLAAGGATLLIDGVDELPPEKREAVRDWVASLAEVYPGARYVVTSRPPAIEEEWLDFVPFDLLSLSAQGIQDFLSRWHEAAQEEYGDEPGMHEWLATCRRELGELIATRPELRRLAANPLLAGLICALYQDRHMHMPRDRKSLYDAALELLLLRWDERRGVRLDQAPALSMEEQVVILQRLAYSLVKNQDILLPRDQAVHRIRHAMRGIRPEHAEPEAVLQRTLERTGLLREVYDGQIQFVHRTFRDYLAAKEVVDAGDLGLLIENAHLDPWHDVVIMAVAHARPIERERLLGDLLAGNAAARERPAVHDRLRLLAAACLAQADVTESDEIRDQVHRAAQRLIPPASLDDAELLARAGPFVLELLPGPEGLNDEQAAGVVRTAAMIGGEAARDTIARFTAIDQALVIDELLRAWRVSDDPERYATEVLADVDFGDRRLDIQRWSRVQYLRHLRRLTTVSCRGDLTPLDPLAAIPNLRRLELLQNTVLRNLTPLTTARELRVLHLASCPMLRDLSPLRHTRLTELRLYLMNASLPTLTGAPITRLVIRDRTLTAGLHDLPDTLPLTELVLENRPPDRNLQGIERFTGLRHVEFIGTPSRLELESLAALPHLTTLTVHAPDSIDALVELPALTHLTLHAVRDDVRTKAHSLTHPVIDLH